MSDSTTPVFGETRMSEKVADVSDLTNTLQHAALKTNSFPTDAIEGYIVQLTANVSDGIAGHFYRYTDVRTIPGYMPISGTGFSPYIWFDVTAYVKDANAWEFSGTYCAASEDYDNLIKFSWVDQAVNRYGAPWRKTVIYEIEPHAGYIAPFEKVQVYSSTTMKTSSSPATVISVDNDSMRPLSERKFMMEVHFADGTSSFYDMDYSED